MITRCDARQFMEMAHTLPILDVRSPGEFLQGHIPAAFNLPLFSDEERAVVGTIYKNSGREASVLKGMEIAGPGMAAFVKKAFAIAPGKTVLLHCWRGGMRSENMAWIFDQAGFRVTVLEGGYKSYRRFIRTELVKDLDLVVLGGMTGSGKTEILQSMQSLGEQVIDLENAACHKGSVFGGLGEDPQPTNEQFENELYALKEKLDLSRRIWVEDESRMLGNITLPDPFFSLMEHSVLVRIEVPVEDRISRLVSMYAHFSKEELGDAVTKISEKLGGTRTRTAMEAIRDSDFKTVAELALSYYDKAYRNAISRRPNQEIITITVDHKDANENAREIIRQINSVRIQK